MINIYIEKSASEKALIEITRFVRCTFMTQKSLTDSQYTIDICFNTRIEGATKENELALAALLHNINLIIEDKLFLERNIDGDT